jgi:hypothetical protein
MSDQQNLRGRAQNGLSIGTLQLTNTSYKNKRALRIKANCSFAPLALNLNRDDRLGPTLSHRLPLSQRLIHQDPSQISDN